MVIYHDVNGAAQRGTITAAPAARARRGAGTDSYTVSVGPRANRRVALSNDAYGVAWSIVGVACFDEVGGSFSPKPMANIEGFDDVVAQLCASNERDRRDVPANGNCMMLAAAAQMPEITGTDASKAACVRKDIAGALEGPANHGALAPFITAAMLASGETIPAKDDGVAVATILRRRAEMHRTMETSTPTMAISTWGGDLDFQALAIVYGVLVYVIFPWGAVTIFSPSPSIRSKSLGISPEMVFPPNAIVCVLTTERNHYHALVVRP